MSALAGTIVNAVRDLIPDPTPTYLSTGIPDPDENGGLIRASTMYRWLDSGVRIMARACGSVIEDWYAVAQRHHQPFYRLSDRFNSVTHAFSNLWPCDLRTLNAGDVIWPNAVEAQAATAYVHKRTDVLAIGLFPVPSRDDPRTSLSAGITPTAGDPIEVGATTDFLPYGYVLVDAEIIQYYTLSTTPVGLGTITRGACGTTAASHAPGAIVSSLGFWVKGTRSPAAISAANSLVELPLDVVSHLETYLLACCRRSENEEPEAKSLFEDFARVCREIRGDPNRRQSVWQLPMYGQAVTGLDSRLFYWGRVTP
jgi:hypothetical protein